MMPWALAWLGLAATLITGQVLVCGSTLPGEDDNIVTAVLNSAVGTHCDGTAGRPDMHPAVQFTLFLLITVPGLILIFSLVAPILSASVGGLIAFALALTALGLTAFFAGFA